MHTHLGVSLIVPSGDLPPNNMHRIALRLFSLSPGCNSVHVYLAASRCPSRISSRDSRLGSSNHFGEHNGPLWSLACVTLWSPQWAWPRAWPPYRESQSLCSFGTSLAQKGAFFCDSDEVRMSSFLLVPDRVSPTVSFCLTTLLPPDLESL